MSTGRPHVVVLGGGVIGISTAIALLDHPVSPCDVTVVACDLPSLDPASYSAGSSLAAPSSYASAWAGAHHVSDAKDEKQLARDKITFDVLRKLEPLFGSQALVWVHQTEYFAHKATVNAAALDWYPDYQPLPSSALPNGTAFGCTLTTYDIVVPQYLPKLYQLFLSLGGKSVCAKASSISDALALVQTPAPRNGATAPSLPSVKPSVVVVSPGLGARELVDDSAVHPVRGQTVLVRAPWCTTAKSAASKWPAMSRVTEADFRDMYILPRGDGTFIVGGTRLVDDWDTAPRPQTTLDILSRALDFMPALARPTESGGAAQASNVDIVGVNVGLRPARRGGVRLEAGETVEGTAVVYSYGYGGFGYQCSWGAAFEARNLVDDALHRPRAPAHSTLASLDAK